MKAPNCCPMCGEVDGWKLIDTTKKGFSAGKAIVGGILLGGVGLVAGALGKKKSLYTCTTCKFQHEYDGEAPKEMSSVEKLKEDGYKNTGTNAVWLKTICQATPDCQFCGQTQDLYIKYNFNDSDYSLRCGHCFAEFRCNFSFGGKVLSKSVQIMNCGNINQNGLQSGACDANVLIKDFSKIK